MPANLLAAGVFVGDDMVTFPDYAPLGVRLLLEWLEFAHAAAREQPSILGSRIDCMHESASVIFVLKMSDEEGRFLFSAQWALEVALAASGEHRLSASDVNSFPSVGKASHRYFYMWFWDTLCCEEDAIARACRYMAAYSRHCHEVPLFDC